ncbi:protein of unknown function [Methylorubrum extorquens]|uniref:Uncharacterized protein n=1 Tax=Methylorubrum extorquens TaxID=408 RepID=A0A2N9AHF4_METEX|nr:protein of unknown function [Methylorubrum extorquens]
MAGSGWSAWLNGAHMGGLVGLVLREGEGARRSAAGSGGAIVQRQRRREIGDHGGALGGGIGKSVNVKLRGARRLSQADPSHGVRGSLDAGDVQGGSEAGLVAAHGDHDGGSGLDGVIRTDIVDADDVALGRTAAPSGKGNRCRAAQPGHRAQALLTDLWRRRTLAAHPVFLTAPVQGWLVGHRRLQRGVAMGDHTNSVFPVNTKMTLCRYRSRGHVLTCPRLSTGREILPPTRSTTLRHRSTIERKVNMPEGL